MDKDKIHIGGSTAPTLLGLNPYQGEMDAYMRLLELIDPPVENEPMKWGSAAEHVVARRYAKETGTTLLPSIDEGYDRLKPMVHPQYSWWTGTPDRLVEPDGGLEIKIVSERNAHQWSEEEVPDMYMAQCHWYLGLTGRNWWDLAVQIGNRDYRVYRILRDEEMIETLRQAAENFIDNHLVPEIPPAIDASEASNRYLKMAYPQDQGEMIPAPPDAEHWAEQLARAEHQIAVWESIKTLNQNLLKGVIGNHKGVQSGRWKATWTLNKPSQKVDWERAFREIAAEHEPGIVEGILSNHTTIKPGARVFRASVKGLIEED